MREDLSKKLKSIRVVLFIMCALFSFAATFINPLMSGLILMLSLIAAVLIGIWISIIGFIFEKFGKDLGD